MLNRGYKLIISVILVTTLLFCCCFAFADAATPVWLLRAKSAVLATMLAMDLVTTPINVILDAPLAESVDPLGSIPWVETLPEYLDRSVIKVLPDTVIIDGVEYSDIWLGPDAAENLRLQALDFASAYNLINNQEGISYASGVGYVDDVPIYRIDRPSNSKYSSQGFSIPGVGTYQIDGVLVEVSDYTNTHYLIRASASGSSPQTFAINKQEQLLFSSTSSTVPNNVLFSSFNGSAIYGHSISRPLTSSPFEFDYTSGVIDAPKASDDGLLIRVPTQYTDPESPSTVVYDIHDLININPSVTQPGGHEINIDPTLNPNFETDLDLGNGLGDLLLTIFGLDLLNKIINFAPEPVSPDPQPQPGVIDPLPDPDPAPDYQ